MEYEKIVTLYDEEYKNIQSLPDKKIKVQSPKFKSLIMKGQKVRVANLRKPELEPQEVTLKAPEEVKPVVDEPIKHFDEEPMHFYGADLKSEFNFDGNAIKEKIAENYKKTPDFNKKEERKIDIAPKAKVSEKDFERLLSTEVVIMDDKMEKFRQVFAEKQTKLKEAKEDQARYADSFQKVSNEQQVAKADSETKKKRIAEMKKAENFAYLEIGKDEDDRMAEAIRLADNALKNLYNVNQIIYKEAIAKIEQCENDKNMINTASEKVRAEIRKASDDLNKFMENNEPLIKEIIKINEKYKDAEVETENAIKDEYDALTKERNASVGINLNIPEVAETPVNEPVQPEVNNIPNVNPFENFRLAASEGGNEAAVGINDAINSYQEQPVGYGRAA